MWRRLRRRTFAPSRPALYPDQIGLLIFTVLGLGLGIYAVARFLL
jgi:F0F1-type ATP synthase assembly protein I